MNADPEMSQYLEDERLAIMLQNSEFLQELRGNEEFMQTLERGKGEFQLILGLKYFISNLDIFLSQ